MHDDIEHRVMLARAMREAGAGYDLIAAVLRANSRIPSNSNEPDSRITEARKQMAATLQQLDASNLPG